MILRLNRLVFTGTHLGDVWVSLVPEGAAAGLLAAGLLATGSYLVTAFNTTGRVWISNQRPGLTGEGMETAADTLEAFLLDGIGLPGADGALTVELKRDELDRLIDDYYQREF